MVAHRVLERHAHTAEGLSGPELDHCLDLHGRSSPVQRYDRTMLSAPRTGPAARTETRTSSGCSTSWSSSGGA